MTRTIRISDETYSDLDDRGTTSDSFDDVIRRLIERDRKNSVNADGETTDQPSEPDSDTNTDANSTNNNEEYITVFLGPTPPDELRHEKQNGAMQAAVSKLVEEHDLIENIDIPYRTGGNQAIIAKEPQHPDGSEMRDQKEIPAGNWLETSFNKEDKQRWIRTLADECDINVAFTGNWN
jgi:predicted CopG family antitoxin